MYLSLAMMTLWSSIYAFLIGPLRKDFWPQNSTEKDKENGLGQKYDQSLD